MNFNTKFNIGDHVFTINTSTLKTKEFDVKRIFTSTSPDGATRVTLYEGDSYLGDGYDEDKCFSNEADLITFITTPNEPKAL